jgi:hypothetical protein
MGTSVFSPSDKCLSPEQWDMSNTVRTNVSVKGANYENLSPQSEFHVHFLSLVPGDNNFLEERTGSNLSLRVRRNVFSSVRRLLLGVSL